MNVNNQTGEVIKATGFRTVKRENIHVMSVGSSKVDVYDFVNTYEAGPSGTKEDYRVIKKPKKVDSYDIKKVMVERCKGCDLKSIVARMEKTGDVSILNQRPVVYGDARQIPASRSDAFDSGVKSSTFLDSLSAKQKEELIAMAKYPKKFEEFIEAHKKQTEVKTEVKTEQEGDVTNG